MRGTYLGGLFDGAMAVEFFRNLGVGLWYHDPMRFGVGLVLAVCWVWFSMALGRLDSE